MNRQTTTGGQEKKTMLACQNISLSFGAVNQLNSTGFFVGNSMVRTVVTKRADH